MAERVRLMTTYEARPAGCRPRQGSTNQTFSVAIGEVVPALTRRPAAIYRVRGKCRDEEQVDALARRLVDWLNFKLPHIDMCELPSSFDRSARIVLTQAGNNAGWLGP